MQHNLEQDEILMVINKEYVSEISKGVFDTALNRKYPM